jgi:hypothetical protein
MEELVEDIYGPLEANRQLDSLTGQQRMRRFHDNVDFERRQPGKVGAPLFE